MARLARGSAVLASALQLGAYAGTFSPFSDVEELKPRRLHDFCEAGDGKSKLRRCQHSFRKRLDDGGDVHLRWSMLVDPDSILSLDTEEEHGVLLTGCHPDDGHHHHAGKRHHLHLELPETHGHHAAEGKFIVASRFSHGCGHIGDENLYHRVVEVKHREVRQHPSGGRKHHVHLATEGVPSLAHVVPKYYFHFEWMPSEAMDPNNHFPERRTDWGQHKKPKRELLSRRLSSLNPLTLMKNAMKSATTAKGVSADNGGLSGKGSSQSSVDLGDTILNLHPKQMSNFGWNWDFDMNTTEHPEIKLDAPGAKGTIRLYKPYAKMHCGIFFNHTSEMADLTKIPLVDWSAGLAGHGQLHGRMFTWLNTTATAGVDPLGIINFPIIKALETPKWFDKIDFSTANLPLSMQPGMQFNGKLYHKGEFKGAVAAGLRTKAKLNPVIHYNSKKGIEMHCPGCDLTDSDIWPPMWIVFTKKFELGLMGMPELLMKGDFGGLEKATLAWEARPYMNMTITREGNGSSTSGSEQLIAYPFRVMGLTNEGFGTQYKVKVSLANQSVETSSAINWGTVTFHDNMNQFNLGAAPQSAILNKPMTVTLYSVDSSGTETSMGSGTYTCTSLLDGECHPAPSIVPIKSTGGDEVAAVEMAVVWDASPGPWFASHIRGMTISFPSVKPQQQLLDQLQPKLNNGSSVQFSLLFLHGGRSYAANVSGSSTSNMAGQTSIVFGPTLISVWVPCSETSAASSTMCKSPTVELLCDGQVIAEAILPSVDATSETAMTGTYTGWGGSSSGLDVPLTVALTAPGQPSSTPLAVVSINAHITSIMSSGQFMKPKSASKVALDGSELIVWMIPDVDSSQDYNFNMQILKLSSTKPTGTGQNRKVGDEYLEPVGNPIAITSKCQATAMSGMPTTNAPCSFSYLMYFSKENLQVNDVVVLLVQWLQGSGTLAMRSPPLMMETSTRRLQAAPEEEVDFHLAGIPVRRLTQQTSASSTSSTSSSGTTAPAATGLNASGTTLSPKLQAFKKQWDSQVAKHSEGCSKKNLKFRIGSGLVVRGKLQSVQVPEGFPMMGGMQQAPQLTTGWRKLAHNENGSSLKNLLASSMCQAGMCDGALPGCTNFTPKKVHVPIINLEMNRSMSFTNTSKHKLLRNAFAYAFSMMPEVVDVVVKDINSSSWFKNAEEDDEIVPVGAVQQPVLGAPTGATPPPTSQPAPAPAQPAPEANLERFWPAKGVQRRLKEEAPRGIVQIRFVGKTPYEVTPEMVGMMIEQGYFEEVEDMEDDHFHEKGPVRITGFRYDMVDPLDLPIEQGYSLRSSAAVQQRAAVQRPQGAVKLAAGVVAAACMVAAAMALVALRRSARDFEADEVDESRDSRALE